MDKNVAKRNRKEEKRKQKQLQKQQKKDKQQEETTVNVGNEDTTQNAQQHPQSQQQPKAQLSQQERVCEPENGVEGDERATGAIAATLRKSEEKASSGSSRKKRKLGDVSVVDYHPNHHQEEERNSKDSAVPSSSSPSKADLSCPTYETAVVVAEKETAKKKRKKKKKKKKKPSLSPHNDDYDDDDGVNNGANDETAVQEVNDDALALTKPTAAITSPEFPFPTEADDHCESPSEAYRDILPLLQRLEELLSTTTKKKVQQQLRIYDPYFCNGAVKQHFAALGFPSVYNEKEDCYQVWKGDHYPEFDVLVTNPPYSGDHIEKLMQHLASPSSLFLSTSKQQQRNRPWFLLLPNWVHKKDFYQAALDASGCHPFYLVPRKRYVYQPPQDFRQAKKSDTHKKSSPFVSMWYIWGGTPQVNDDLIRTFYKIADSSGNCDLARSKSALRDLRRKPNKKKR